MRVTGRIEVQFDVDLPDHCPATGACDDPAVEAVVEAIPGVVNVYVWGEEADPARVTFDVYDGDVEIFEDDRITRPEQRHDP